jgi:hypothetical protein
MRAGGHVIHLISGPRNLSTALMYAFSRRSDTRVVDEPFYGHYLRVSGADHPGREEVLASQTQPAAVIQSGFFAQRPTPHLFVKNMAHHLRDMDLDWLGRIKNVFLIRDPHQLIASFAQVIPQPTAEDIGLPQALALFELIRSLTGRAPLVLDSGDLLSDPPGMLLALCEALGLPFDKNMLHWPEGGIPEDGVWAPYWYANVHRSTGFARQSTSSRPMPEHCLVLYEEVLPLYRTLSAYALKA